MDTSLSEQLRESDTRELNRGQVSAVFYYGFLLMTDQKNIPKIESLSQEMGFSAPKLNAELKLRNDLPLLIVRAGLDNIPYLNDTIDHFIFKAVN